MGRMPVEVAAVRGILTDKAKQFIGPIWVLDGMANGVMHWGIALGILVAYDL